MKNIFLYDLVNARWKKIGFNMHHNTIKMNIMTIVLLLLLLITFVLGVCVLFFEEINTNVIADVFEICGPYSQVIVKLTATKILIKQIHQMLQQMKNEFWDINKFDLKFENQLLYIKNLVNKSFTIFGYMCFVTITIVCLRPIIVQQRAFPFFIYNFIDKNNDFYYFFMYGIQITNCITGAHLLLAVDGLYILFISNICVQLLMLKHGFSTLQFGGNDEREEQLCYLRIIEYVKHHDMIIKFIKKFTSLVSFQMFNQFIGNTISLCMGIYIASSGSDLVATIKAFVIVILFAAELFLFCVGGTLITELGTSITHSIYSINWEDSKSLKKFGYAVRMISMRSQKPVILKAGNMFKINFEGFALILKTSVSVYTLMNNVNVKTEKQ